jgi:hypothetical protein
MTRPNLVNPNHWTPFKSIPLLKSEPIAQPQPQPQFYPQHQQPISSPSILNICAILLILLGIYFLYSMYKERKLAEEYMQHLEQNKKNNTYPGFI